MITYLARIIFKAFTLSVLPVVLLSCDRDRRQPGWDYFPDMFYSTAYETFTKNPNFSDGMTMRIPPSGTVPRDYTPFEYTIDPESRIKAGFELHNPYAPTDDYLVRGKKAFTIFCTVCHGEKGQGDGNLYSSGLYPMKPRDLTRGVVLNLKDGEIYHTITLGFGSMGAYGSQVQPDDRWKLVMYIRKLQEYASLTPVTEENKNK